MSVKCSDPVVTGVRLKNYPNTVEIKCPYCKRKHQHGLDPSMFFDGSHRISHCNAGGYTVRLLE
jgi:threonine dehydrogenase-like Zn-dependent dehydrogenase